MYALYVLSFEVYQAKNDQPGMAKAMEDALAVDGERHPEILFNLGATYAIASPPDPRAREMLDRFVRRVCRGAAAAKYRDQCEVAQSLVQRLSR